MLKHRVLIIFGFITLLAGCYGFHLPTSLPDPKLRNLLTTKLANLSAVVDQYFNDLHEAPTGKDPSSLLKEATHHKPELLADEFESYVLKVQYQSPYAVLLLCTLDETQAIMEDAGCSVGVDRQVTQQPTPCKFTLRVSEGCKVKGADNKR